MKPRVRPDFDNPLDAMVDSIAEGNRRERGEFDGLFGNFDPQSSQLLRDMISHLSGYLLERYSEDEARRLLARFEPTPGFRATPVVDDGVQLAVDLLIMAMGASNCTGDKFIKLIFGAAGMRGQKHQAGSKKGGDASAAARAGNSSKAAAIVAAAKDYRGSPSSMAANIAQKVGATPQYVHAVLKKEKGN